MAEIEKEKKSDIMTGHAVHLYSWKAVAGGLRGIHKRAIFLLPLSPGERLIDIGCGSGAVLRGLHSRYPKAELLGVDGSEDMINRAKIESPKEITFKRAYASELPSIDNYYDAAVSVLAAHHMPPEEKRGMIGEAKRVLKPGGKLLIVDFGRPRTILGRILSLIFAHQSYTKGNIELIEENLKEKGFKIQSRSWYLGYVEFILAKKP